MDLQFYLVLAGQIIEIGSFLVPLLLELQKEIYQVRKMDMKLHI
jgi:hypothetical protein